MARAGKMSKGKWKKWTKKDIDVLYRTVHLPLDKIQALLSSRSINEIKAKRFELKVSSKTPFTADEDLFLEENAGMLPLQSMVQQINKEFNVVRTYDSVRTRMVDLGLKWKLEWDNLPMNKWQTTLNLTLQDFINWRREGLITPQKIGRFKTVSIEQMLTVINKYPQAFANSDEQLLLCYFGEEVYQKIIELKKQGLKRPDSRGCYKPVKIKCIKTGLIFNSMQEAAKYFNCSKSNIYQKTKRGKFIRL